MEEEDRDLKLEGGFDGGGGTCQGMRVTLGADSGPLIEFSSRTE
jgi:hypothetical protein